MKKLSLGILILAIISFVGCQQTEEKVGDKLLLPSEALEEIRETFFAKRAELDTEEKTKDARKTIANEYLSKIDLEVEDKTERLVLIDILLMAEQKDKAKEMLLEIAKYDDHHSRDANKRLIEMAIDDEDVVKAEELINNYRRTFLPSTEDIVYLYGPVSKLVEYYNNVGDAQAAVKAIMSELDSISMAEPFISYNLMAFSHAEFKEAGQEGEFKELLNQYIERVDARLTELSALNPADEEKESHKNRISGFENIKMRMTNTRTQISLVGKMAPKLNLSNFYNTEPTDLDRLKGKVVMLDFWANWCGPCKEAFPAMRELYSMYKDRGFVLLGITSFQGRFFDGTIREREISREREIELTTDFVKEHNMTWPVAFSDRSVYDPQYGVSGIPTFAILDREGVIAHIQVGSGEASEAILKELIPKLLAK